MRTLLPLLLLTLLLPVAAARPDVPCENGFCEVGPCLVGSSPYWPGYALLVRCRDYSGDEFLFVADYTCDGGLNGVGVRVFGIGHSCITPRTLLQDILPQSVGDVRDLLP